MLIRTSTALRRIPLSLAVAALVTISCKKEETPVAEPTYTPGALETKRFESLDLSLSVPNNVTAQEKGSEVILEAPGFPTVTISIGEKGNGTGRMSSTGSGGVSVKMMGPEKTWICKSGPAGAHKDLIKSICDSLKPKENPRLLPVDCKIEGWDEKAVKGLFTAHEKALSGCFEAAAKADPKFISASLSTSMNRNAGSTSSGMSTGQPAAVQDCLKAVFEKVRADPALVGDGSFSCNVTYTLY
jgi:hypothetical protein